MYFRRPNLNRHLRCRTCADGWQEVDATPQELSLGGDGGLPAGVPSYMMGPAPTKLVKRNLDPVCAQGGDPKYGCFDTQFVISEVNSYIFMHVKSAAGVWGRYPEGCDASAVEDCGFPTEPFGDPFGTIGLQISTKKRAIYLRRACAARTTTSCATAPAIWTTLHSRTRSARRRALAHPHP